MPFLMYATKAHYKPSGQSEYNNQGLLKTTICMINENARNHSWDDDFFIKGQRENSDKKTGDDWEKSNHSYAEYLSHPGKA